MLLVVRVFSRQGAKIAEGFLLLPEFRNFARQFVSHQIDNLIPEFVSHACNR